MEPLKFWLAGDITIAQGVSLSMNGGSVLVNPSTGANFSGGSGSGGAIKLVASNIFNYGTLPLKVEMHQVWTLGNLELAT